MTITLEMILTQFLRSTAQEQKIEYPCSGRAILGIQLLPNHTRDLRPEFLYVTDTNPRHSVSRIPEDIFVLCFTDKKPDIDGVETQVPSGWILFYTDMELADGFNLLLQSYQHFVDWGRHLDLAVFRSAGFQELIELSEEVITFPVLIYDPALKLLAHSTNQTALNDRIFQSAISNGYLDAETVKYFDRTHIFEQMDNTGTAVGISDNFREHDDLAIAINIQNELAVYCVMLYTGDDSRSYSEQVFRIFCESVQNLLEKQHVDFLRNRSVTDYFLMDLLDNPQTPKKQVQERIVYNDLDYEGNFILITIHSDIRQKPSENYFIQILRNNMINCRIFPYKQKIIVLYNLPKFRETSYRDYLTHQLDPILKDFSSQKLTLYFSRPFSTIGEFAAAYTQAENVCRILCGNTGNRFCFYEDYCIEDFFLMNGSSDLVFSYCEPALLTMLKNDTKKSRQQLQILYEYLRCDRKLTEAAKKLDMHRNNVLYHVRQMEEAFAMDLDDPQTRLKLLLSFELLKYKKMF